jgi:phospholipid N-methyltransferase
MPFSATEFDSEIELYFRLIRHESIVDIGPGEGKYGRMLRRVQPDTKLIGIELDADYVEQYKLRELYDEVWVSDAADLMNDPDRTFDAVIIGDCIEHMRKSIGLDLLNFLVYRSKLIAVKFPLQIPQNAWQGHKSEAHLSVWSEHDFRGMDYLFAERNFICLALIRGYLNQTMEWIPPAAMQRFGYADMAEFYARDPSRLSLADVQSRRENLSLPEIRSTIPSGATYVLVDELQTRLASDGERRSVPFLEKDGKYWGRPADNRQAITEIERLRKTGCTHIIFAWPALWWLNYYEGFNQYLRSNFYCTLDNERLVAFDLRRPSDSSSCRQV